MEKKSSKDSNSSSTSNSPSLHGLSPATLSHDDEISETNSSNSSDSSSQINSHHNNGTNVQLPVVLNQAKDGNSKNNVNSSSSIAPGKVNSIQNSKSQSSGNLSGSGSGIPLVLGDGNTNLEGILTSIRSGNTTFLSNALKQKPVIPLTYVLPSKNTFLHAAVEATKMTSVNLILEKTKNTPLVNTQNEKMKTPLFLACELFFFKAASALLDNGASPLIPNQYNWTSLHKLCSIELKEKLFPNNPSTDALMGYSIENHQELIEKIFKMLSKPHQVVGLKTVRNQTPLHLSILAHNHRLNSFLLGFATAESLNVKDDNGNTPLHLTAYYKSSKMLPVAETILRIMYEALNGEELRNFIDEPNNLMASSLQVSMKVNSPQMNQLIVKYRHKAETKILDKLFEDLATKMAAHNDSTKLPVESITYLDPAFQATQFGQLFKRIVVIIKQHYVINMSHQNANVLLVRAKDTIKRFFEWMEKNVHSDHEHCKLYKEILLSQVYDTVIHLYKETYKSRDLFFQQRVAYFKKIDHSEIDITEHSWEQNIDLFPKALEIMNSLPKKRTPWEKIRTLNEATMHISRTDANDLTPMFMFLLIRSNIDNIQSEFQFMDDFKETPEQEQYLVLLQGSLDYLETLNFTLRNAQNQIMSLSGIVERTLDNILSLIDEFNKKNNSNNSSSSDEDIDDGTVRIMDEITLISMLISKLSNRIDDQPIYLPLKWSDQVINAYHFRAILERLGLRLDLNESNLLKTPPTESPSISSSTSSSSSGGNTKQDLSINNPGYVCQKKGAVCLILEHPYPQMVYQVLENEIRAQIIPKIQNKII